MIAQKEKCYVFSVLFVCISFLLYLYVCMLFSVVFVCMYVFVYVI